MCIYIYIYVCYVPGPSFLGVTEAGWPAPNNIYIYIYIHTHRYTYIYIYIERERDSIYMCIYIYIYIYIHTNNNNIADLHFNIEIDKRGMLKAPLSCIGCIFRRRNTNPQYLASSLPF